MNVLTAFVLCAALAAGEPGSAEGAKSSSPDGGGAKSKPSPKKSGTSGSLDDDLFGDLTGELFQGLEKPKLEKSAAKESAKPRGDAKQQPGVKQPPLEKNPPD